ncbi:N-acetyltransferase GCN5 OS=Streptomyces microflavus OX=1919 GN=Smic_61600 PE=4 SV=1 [Streptomyces microflavus]
MVADRPLRRTSPPTRCVRRVRKDETENLMPACVAMFTEEVGISPLAGDGGLLYQARVAELIGAGRSLRPHRRRGKVVFKAEIGAATHRTCQIQGVWVAPEHRGRGVAAPGMAAVPPLRPRGRRPRDRASTSTTSTPPPAGPTARVGFQEVGEFMSILF